MLRTVPRAALAAAGILLLGACGRGEQPIPAPVSFDTTVAWVHAPTGDSVRLLVEVAETEAQRRRGLMERPSLDSASGMVFLFDREQPAENGFWMWQTLIPLDIAYIDADGAIVRVLTMEPCASQFNPGACPSYPPGVAYHSTLEVNRGWFASHGLGEGARVTIDGRPPGR
jgi:uncharacterized protein